MSASDIRTAPLLAEAWHRARRGQIVGPRHARPQAGAVRGSGPAASGEFDHACARCRRNARSGRRNRCFDRTKEHGSASIRACRGGRSLDTVTCPIGGETENASHTEILTLPFFTKGTFHLHTPFSSISTSPSSIHSRTSFPEPLSVRRCRSRELFVSRFRVLLRSPTPVGASLPISLPLIGSLTWSKTRTPTGLLRSRINLPYRAVSKHLGTMGE